MMEFNIHLKPIIRLIPIKKIKKGYINISFLFLEIEIKK